MILDFVRLYFSAIEIKWFNSKIIDSVFSIFCKQLRNTTEAQMAWKGHMEEEPRYQI